MGQEERIEYFMSEIARLSNQIVDLQDERDALAATVEALREMANRANVHLTKGYAGQSFSAIDCNLALSALAEIDSFTPQQHLAEIRAQAVIDAVNFGRSQTKYFLRSSEDILQQIEQYAENIRQGKK